MASGANRILSSRLGSTTSRISRVRNAYRIKASATALPKQFKKVTPVGDRVFVKVDEADFRSAGGLVLPSSAQKSPTKGQVTTVSQGCSLKTGDRVVYGEYSGTDITVKGVPHVLLKEDDVVGLLDGEDVSKLKPLGDRILVEVSESEDETSAGLILTSAVVEKPTFGKVLSIGPGKKVEDKRTPPNVSVGSTVLYSKYSGTEFQGKDDKEYIVIHENDVLAELK
eukprot:g6724.t1